MGYKKRYIIMEYIKLSVRKPKNGDKIWASVSTEPLVPLIAIYKKGKFYLANDESIEIFPKYWKYPNVPFAF